MAIERISKAKLKETQVTLSGQPRQRAPQVKYSKRIFQDICNRIISGDSLLKICSEPDYPDRITFFRWLEKAPELLATYTRAKELQADYYAEQMLDVIDNASSTRDEIERAKVKVETLKWIASKLKPKKYGDKLDVTSDGERIERPIYGGASLGKSAPIEGEVVPPKPPKTIAKPTEANR